jgi:hypothetical protein
LRSQARAGSLAARQHAAVQGDPRHVAVLCGVQSNVSPCAATYVAERCCVRRGGTPVAACRVAVAVVAAVAQCMLPRARAHSLTPVAACRVAVAVVPAVAQCMLPRARAHTCCGMSCGCCGCCGWLLRLLHSACCRAHELTPVTRTRLGPDQEREHGHRVRQGRRCGFPSQVGSAPLAPIEPLLQLPQQLPATEVATVFRVQLDQCPLPALPHLQFRPRCCVCNQYEVRNSLLQQPPATDPESATASAVSAQRPSQHPPPSSTPWLQQQCLQQLHQLPATAATISSPRTQDSIGEENRQLLALSRRGRGA